VYAPKKQKLPAQPKHRAPPVNQGCQGSKRVGEIPKRVTKSAARAVEQPTYNPPEPYPSTPVFRKGQQGKVLRDFKPTVIHGRKYSGHALHRMNERGLTPLTVENVIKGGKITPDPKPGRLRHYDFINNITVITDQQTGSVISAFFGER